MDNVFTITCDRVTAEEIVAELKKDREHKIQVANTDRRLTGVEVVQIVAALSTFGVNLLKAWLDARPHLKESIKVETTGDARSSQREPAKLEPEDG